MALSCSQLLPEVFFLGRWQVEFFFVSPYVSMLKIFRILWRIDKSMKNTKKDIDPDPTPVVGPSLMGA